MLRFFDCQSLAGENSYAALRQGMAPFPGALTSQRPRVRGSSSLGRGRIRRNWELLAEETLAYFGMDIE
jgi:hypothetical protein